MRLVVLAIISLAAAGPATADDPNAPDGKVRGTITAKGEYVPPTIPRSETIDGALYLAIREIDGAAGKYADRLHPQPPFPGSAIAEQAWQKAERLRLDKWDAAFAQEQKRRLAALSAREHLPVDELEDIRLEGDARAWFTEPRKRANLGKTEEQITKTLDEQREFLRIAKAEEKAERSKSSKRRTGKGR